MTYNGLLVSAEMQKDSSYVIHVRGGNLAWSGPAADGSEHAEVTIAAVWFNRDGKIVNHLVREEVAARGHSPSEAGFLLRSPGMPGKFSRIRIVVRDALSGQMGSTDLAGDGE
jgi:hypothetical protein